MTDLNRGKLYKLSKDKVFKLQPIKNEFDYMEECYSWYTKGKIFLLLDFERKFDHFELTMLHETSILKARMYFSKKSKKEFEQLK